MPFSWLFQAHIFETDSECVAFLVNFDKHKMSNIQLGKDAFQIAPKSISILSMQKGSI
jgi:hypothetical protein